MREDLCTIVILVNFLSFAFSITWMSVSMLYLLMDLFYQMNFFNVWLNKTYKIGFAYLVVFLTSGSVGLFLKAPVLSLKIF